MSLSNDNKKVPKTIKEAVDYLISELSLRQKARIANTSKSDLIFLHTSIGTYIRNEFKLWVNNKELLESCASFIDEKKISPDTASGIILDELWSSLKETNLLRIIK